MDIALYAPHLLPALTQIVNRHVATVQCRDIGSARFAFGVGWLGISSAWTHLTTGLQQAGYRKKNAWVLLTGRTTIPISPLPVPSSAIEFRRQEDSAAAEWVVAAYLSEQAAGECTAWGIPRHFKDCRQHAEWITIEWLGVEPPYQRRGLGRFLLYEQLRWQAQRVVEHAIAWVQPENEAALRVCRSLGFIAGSECWEYEKVIE